MTTEINVATAYEWLETHYKDIPGVWEEFYQQEAAEVLVDFAAEDMFDSYDDVPELTLMCIMADSRM